MTDTGHIIGGPADPDYDGAVLTADLAIGDTVLHVDDTADFDEDAAERDAQLLIGLELDSAGDLDPATGTPIAYSTCDDDTSTVTLSAASTIAASSGDRVYLEDPVSGYPVGRLEVLVSIDGGDSTGDALPATLDVALLESVGNVDLNGLAVELVEDEDGQLLVSGFPGLIRRQGAVRGYQNSHGAASSADLTFDLTYQPLPDSTVHLYWNGVLQEDDAWSIDGWTITVDDPDGLAETDDRFYAKYLYTDPATKPPPTLTVIGYTEIIASDTTVAVPAGAVAGDLLVVAMQSGTFTPSVAASWLDTIYTGDGRWILGFAVHDGSSSYPVTLENGTDDAIGLLTVFRFSGSTPTAVVTAGSGSGPAVVGASSGVFGIVALTGFSGTVAGGFATSSDSLGHWTNVASAGAVKASVLIAVSPDAPVDGSWATSATLSYWNAMTLALS